PFGFAVRTRGVRPGSQVPDAQLGAGVGEALLVAAAVVAQDALDLDAAAGVPVPCAPEKGDRRVRLLVPQHLGVRQPRVVIDGDVHVFPADAVYARCPIPVDTVTRPPDPGELLRVDVQHVPGPQPPRGPWPAFGPQP